MYVRMYVAFTQCTLYGVCVYLCSLHTVSTYVILHAYVRTSNKSAVHVEMPALLLRSPFHLIDPHYW